uniref:Uncharacterized protein n=1 Tax=Homalodisca liturata TaxID=320908 RepID=A0A1B6JAB9_9HEMI
MTAIHESRRNPLPLPPIQHEELYNTPLVWKGYYPGWEDTVCANCRLNMNHTLASIRWNRHLKGPLRPTHSVDLALSAIYQHGPEDFPDKTDVIRQPETVGYPTWRLLRNKRHDPNVDPVHLTDIHGGTRVPFQLGETKAAQSARLHADPCTRSVDPSHPLVYGGLKERRHPFHIKLGISSHHSPQSNNGFSRNSYGAFFTS